jgi:hypothetical protein
MAGLPGTLGRRDMRTKKRTSMFVSGALALALALSACATDDEDPGVDDTGTDPIVTTTLGGGGVSTTLGGASTTAP